MIEHQTNREMKELIGRRFKRNKYGLSNWTDTIVDIWYKRSVKLGVPGFTVEVMVKGTLYDYPLCEVQIESKDQ